MTQLADVFSNRYEIQRGIARGGMAEVYLARDQLLDRPVAVKVLFAEYARDPSFVERFRREAQSAASLNHPNIVAFYDWCQERGTYFIVMEYVRGRSLRDVVQVNGPFSARRTAEIGAEIAGALEFAHRNGVVHRDVKPGNVLLTADGDIKVTDFGIARAGTMEALTQTGAVMGTAAYFSPEQAQGLPVDGRSDVYSLGVVLYEMVTGAPPFTGESPVAVAYKHVREDPEPPAARAPDLPPDLQHIILTAMAKDADSRYQTADELRADLMRFVRGQPPLGGPVTGLVADGTATAAVASTQAAPVAALDGHDPDEHKRKRRGALVAGILGVVLIAAVIIALLAGAGGGGGGGPTAEVPNVVNKPFTEADQALKLAGFKVSRKDVEGKDPPDVVPSQQLLQQAGFQVLVQSEPSDSVPTGRVTRTDPGANAQVKRGASVTMFVSTGPQTVDVPNVVGQTQAQASQALQQAGFQVFVSQQATNNPAENGRVLAQNPSGGAKQN